MHNKRPLAITLIGYFYIFSSIILIITLFTNANDEFGIAVRFGLPNFPENIMRALIAIISLILAYGFLKLKRWGYWFMIIYTSYFLVVSINLSNQYNKQPFYGNVIWSVIVLAYTLMKRKCFKYEVIN